jgi:APA family basic amino acid/polyamine antiporter
LGVFYGASYIFFAYGGFARVAVIAEEVKDAKRNVPKAMLLSLIISTIFYILVGAVAIGLVGEKSLASSQSPLKEAISVTENPAAEYLVSLGGLLATASVLLTSILGVSRMAYAMARRQDLPNALSKLHKKYATPYYSIWIIGALMTILVLSIDLTNVVAISTFALLFYYALANLSALRLKIKERKYPKLIPAIGALTCLALLVFILFVSSQAWVMGTVTLLIGALYYAAKQKFS